VDVAEVNGRIFVNNSAIGLYPKFVRERDAQQRRFGRSKRIAMLFASLRGLRHFSRHRLTIRITGREAPIETSLLFVGNNHYDTSLLALGRRERLDEGALCIYALLARSPLHLLGLALRSLVGQLDQQEDFISLDGVTEAEILSPAALLAVSMDGETQSLPTPLRYRIRPGALPLLVPA
jgi:diacylglycerol kinase family enzyme